MSDRKMIQENGAINNFEIRSRKLQLRSTPQYITIGAHHGCNASCVFCLGGDFPRFSLELYKELFERKMGDVLRKAEHIGFCGFGEILLSPEIEPFLRHINVSLKENTKVFTTNGIALSPAIGEIMTDGHYSLLVSLHAANAALHEQMTRTKSFDHIVARLKDLVALKKKKGSMLHINLIFLLTTLNIDNLPDFVSLAREVGADRVSCSYLTIFQPEQIRLSCFFQQERTNAVFAAAQERADALGMTLILPPRFGKHDVRVGEEPPCFDPWNFFYVETQGSVNPCCFAGDHIGYLDRESFETIWNGPGYIRLRDGLLSGNLFSWCRYCYRYNPNNVNRVLSHVTFRPETQQKILRYLREHKNEYPLSAEDTQL
jgi:MoaA/NifB/PqqE/SkfB family radical SAM enzyme